MASQVVRSLAEQTGSRGSILSTVHETPGLEWCYRAVVQLEPNVNMSAAIKFYCIDDVWQTGSLSHHYAAVRNRWT